MRVEWTTATIGTLYKIVPDEDVLTFCESLIKLGFTPEVTQE